MILLKQTLICIVLFSLLQLAASDAVLNGLPVTFTMSGSETKIPDSGGASQKYCILTVGYVGSSWLGI